MERSPYIRDEVFRTLLENVADAVFVTDDQGLFTLIGPNVQAIFGYELPEIEEMGSIHVLLPGVGIDREELARKGGLQNIEVAAKTKEAELRHLLVDVKPVDIHGGTLLYTCRDVTERKLLADQLVQSQKMEALGTLVAGVAHEVNNPVSQFLLNLPALREIWDDVVPALEALADAGEARTYGRMSSSDVCTKVGPILQNLEEGARRISKIVSSLKRFAGKTAVDHDGGLDLGLALRSVEALTATACRKAGVSLTICDGAICDAVRGDQHAAEQVILNLVNNALEASCYGGSVEVEARPHDGGAIVAVRDRGPGVDSSLGQSIFCPFVTSRRGAGGTGLGLSVSQGLMRVMGGNLEYSNHPEGGAEFRAIFRAAPEAPRPQILVVDDDDAMRTFVVRFLAQSVEAEVIEASTGSEGVMLLAERKPDVMILDLAMPGMDGLEVCQAIYSRRKVLPTRVMILTGLPDDARVEEIRNLGVRTILSKPFRNEEFLGALDSLLKAGKPC